MSDKNNGSILEFATITEIVAELRRRYSGILLVTQGEPGQPADAEYTRIYYGGGRIMAIGAAAWAKEFLMEPVRDSRNFEEDE